jgi:hypothetical protein
MSIHPLTIRSKFNSLVAELFQPSLLVYNQEIPISDAFFTRFLVIFFFADSGRPSQLIQPAKIRLRSGSFFLPSYFEVALSFLPRFKVQSPGHFLVTVILKIDHRY